MVSSDLPPVQKLSGLTHGLQNRIFQWTVFLYLSSSAVNTYTLLRASLFLSLNVPNGFFKHKNDVLGVGSENKFKNSVYLQ